MGLASFGNQSRSCAGVPSCLVPNPGVIRARRQELIKRAVGTQRPSVTLALRRVRGQDPEFKDTHGYTGKSYGKQKQNGAQEKENSSKLTEITEKVKVVGKVCMFPR